MPHYFGFDFYSRRQSYVFRCVECKSIELTPIMNHIVSGNSQKFSNSRLQISPLCLICSGQKEIAGPIWTGSLHDRSFIEKILDELPNCSKYFGTIPRIEGLLSLCKEVQYVSNTLSYHLRN